MSAVRRHQCLQVVTRELLFKLANVIGCSQSVQKHLVRLVEISVEGEDFIRVFRFHHKSDISVQY